MKKSLIALAFGTLGLGIAEFVMMGILPDIAKDLHISIATAGHLISAYALGVCVGAPMLIIARRYPLKHILLVLVGIMMIGNLCAALASNYWVLMIARFISGLPHGAYFGVGSIVAEKLADKGRGSEAVSIMIAGMTIANLFGVPLGTALSTMLSWRLTFLLVGCWGIAILYYIWRWVPMVENLPDTGFKGQFRFLKTQAPWLILGATMLGNGGVFCWYSYISPLLTQVSGFSAESLTVLMVLAGFGHSARHDLRSPTARLLLGTNILVKCLADVSVYGGIIRRLKPSTSIIDPLLQRWRDAGSRQRTSCVQFRKCYRSLLWWVTIGGRPWL